MNNDYETLIDMSKPMLDKLSHDKTLDQQDIDNTVQSLLPYLKTQGVYLSDEDVGKAVAELQYYYATTFTDEDALICDGTHKSTWWTDSSETRKQNKKNYYWDSYRSYLSKHEKYKADVISRIDERTDKVMNNLFDPSNRDITEARRRGMVIGSVQSGKTANYTALVAKAADAGYKIIIIIAGTTSLLRKQTQYRINCGFIGQTDLNKDEPDVVGENMSEENTVSKHRCSSRQEQERKRPFAMTTERMDGDFKSDSRRATQQTNLNNTTSPLIFVIKKNTTVLQQILDWFKGKDLSDQSLLLVDDEADNASVNTRRNTEEATAINKKIRLILNSFKKNAYVGFTATPFANIFIDPGFEKEDDEKDLYPSNFIFSLVSSGEYFGPERVFGPEEAEDSDYIKILPDDNAALDDWMGYFPPKQKKGITSKKIDGLPQTLKDAINLFIFNIWVRNKRGFENKHNSMLVHVSFLIDVHQALSNEIEKYIRELEDEIRNYSSMPGSLEYTKYIKPLKQLFDSMLEDGWASSLDYDIPNFEIMLPDLPRIIQSIEVGMSNSKGSSICYSSDHQTNIIAVGGNALARGFTIENLSVSYFLRNTRMCDTLLQMGRWFGYRRGYDDLCRIFTTEKYYDNFHHAFLATESLVMCVDKMEKTGKTPSDFLIRVQQHPATRMLLTALNKSYMAGSDEGVYLDGCIRERGTIESDMLDDIADYLRYTIQFLKKLGDPSEKAKTFYRWRQVSADLIVDLLRSCPKAIDDQLESGLLEKYVKENDNFKWRVVLPCTQTKGNRFSIPETDISFLKLERYDKLDHDPYSYSFAVSDISQERAGSLPSELPEKDVRSEIRDKRKEPLLIINIFDLYQHLDKKERTPDKKELIKTSVPFFSLSFPGSLASPKFKPLLGFMYNECVREQLRREKENEENADDLGDEDD